MFLPPLTLPALNEETEHLPGTPEWYRQLSLVMALVLAGGLLAGLTLGLMSLDETNLHILKTSGTPQQKRWAERIDPIRKNGHLLLVTMLLANTVINESLPVMLDPIVGTGLTAVIASTALVVVFGEIIPQAACSRYGLAIGAFFAWPVRFLIYALSPIAYPISKLLDYILGESHGVVYRRQELKELVSLHAEDIARGGVLTRDEISIIHGALSLPGKTCEDVMTPIDRVFMLSSNEKLDEKTMRLLLEKGTSRVPIYQGDNKDIIVGLLMVKQLILVDPSACMPITDAPIWPIPSVWRTTGLVEILNQFQEGASHMALVYEQNSDNGLRPNGSNATDGGGRQKLVGIITLEDVIEEILQEEIIDETDVYISNSGLQRVVRNHSIPPFPQATGHSVTLTYSNSPPTNPAPALSSREDPETSSFDNDPGVSRRPHSLRRTSLAQSRSSLPNHHRKSKIFKHQTDSSVTVTPESLRNLSNDNNSVRSLPINSSVDHEEDRESTTTTPLLRDQTTDPGSFAKVVEIFRDRRYGSRAGKGREYGTT